MVSGLIIQIMGMYGSHPPDPISLPIPTMVIGSGPIMAGRGYPVIVGGGRLSIMVAGIMMILMVGFGSLIMNGVLRGSVGEERMAITAGRQ